MLTAAAGNAAIRGNRFLLSILIALTGQKAAHMPQPLHHAGSKLTLPFVSAFI